MRAVEIIQLELDRGQPGPQFRSLADLGFLIDVVVDPEVEQPVLLVNEERFLTLQLRPHRWGLGLRVLGLLLRSQRTRIFSSST